MAVAAAQCSTLESSSNDPEGNQQLIIYVDGKLDCWEYERESGNYGREKQLVFVDQFGNSTDK